MALLEVKNLTHTFSNGFTAISNINLTINSNDFVILAGSNGSGKTVLIRHFNGLLLPTKGKVLLEGSDITKNIMKARESIGLIFQDSNSQIVGQTVFEDVAFGPENLRLPHQEIEERVNHALTSVQMFEQSTHRPYTLSGGQKRKLAIAGVIAMKPKLLVFDEPFTGLDYPGVIQVLKQLVLLHDNGHTIIVVTHELEKVLGHSNRLIIMEKGTIVKDDLPQNLIAQLEHYGIKKPYGIDREVKTMTWLN